MNHEDKQQDPWALPTLGLWFIFFFVGLFPEMVFMALRHFAGVVTIGAYINNPEVITLAFTVYLAVFTFRRAREGGLNDAQAQGRAVQVGIVAIFAFLWQPLGMVGLTGDMMHSVWWQARVVLIVAFAFLKLMAWFYLLSLVVRYYGFNNDRVFADMLCIFPSASLRPSDPEEGKGDKWEAPSPKEPSE